MTDSWKLKGGEARLEHIRNDTEMSAIGDTKFLLDVLESREREVEDLKDCEKRAVNLAIERRIENRSLQDKLEESILVIKKLAYGTDTICWCDMAIGNPMYKNHSSSCVAARDFLLSLENEGKERG